MLLQSKSTKRCARAADSSLVAPSGAGRLKEKVDEVKPALACGTVGNLMVILCPVRAFTDFCRARAASMATS